MRIISGKYGKRRFQVPTTFRARPTTDLAKEALFNILNNRIEWSTCRCLDLFAGTGSIGFEMLSQGAQKVWAIEKDHKHAAFIKKVARELGDPAYAVTQMDVLKWLKASEHSEQYDLIFADPPYDMAELKDLPGYILGSGLLAEDGLLVVEHPKTIDFSNEAGFTELRRYGAVHFSFFSNQ